MTKRKRPRKDTTMDNKEKAGHSSSKSEQKLWWIGWKEWFGWKEWMCSKWRDKSRILQNRKPGEAGNQNQRSDRAENRNPATEQSRQPKMIDNETDQAGTGWRRLTSTGNFGTYQRMCGFGGGECRSVFRTLRENNIK